ncbi:hypothetical protein GCM10011371_24180 [Novosphingobium marinum]|uniref:DUF465 domain-containing protein n=1 Tax=Novosphingobium marinum TaxID=1514948 RepID=A0A7Y9Y047_9SPHN|nr:DUF465 domain-containing protein [Novosphingobium marinum]NYH96533.1 hypothetical protein [Novosphingobium marinum]GGC35986.1 hypothetical protein GCM10011371_24180 [Novosphingobium marinum]
MSHTPHELSEEFPNDAEVLHRLKVSDPHFASLAERYHVLNREIHRIEAGVEASSDERAEVLKKERLSLLDSIGGMIAENRRVVVQDN